MKHSIQFRARNSLFEKQSNLVFPCGETYIVLSEYTLTTTPRDSSSVFALAPYVEMFAFNIASHVLSFLPNLVVHVIAGVAVSLDESTVIY